MSTRLSSERCPPDVRFRQVRLTSKSGTYGSVLEYPLSPIAEKLRRLLARPKTPERQR